MGFGLVVMYSASGQSLAMMDRQAMRMAMALIIMVILAQIPPRTYESAALSYFFAASYCWCVYCCLGKSPKARNVG